jgi:hypothetical protein
MLPWTLVSSTRVTRRDIICSRAITLLQGRGGDREIAHLTPGEVVIPRNLLTPGLMRAIAAEAARQGIDPARYTVGHKTNLENPRTGAKEFNGCNPGDPGECFVPMHQIDVIGYVGNWPPAGVSLGNGLPENFGDGAGGGGGGGDGGPDAEQTVFACGEGEQLAIKNLAGYLIPMQEKELTRLKAQISVLEQRLDNPIDEADQTAISRSLIKLHADHAELVELSTKNKRELENRRQSCIREGVEQPY